MHVRSAITQNIEELKQSAGSLHVKVTDGGAVDFVNEAAEVTSVSAQIKAANAARKYLLVQNNDAAGVIYVGFGDDVTTANGIKIGPGEAYEVSGVVPTNAVFVIGSIASNPNVVIVEG